MPKILGADWVNLNVVRDLSTEDYLFEIHLVIDLQDEANAVEAERLIIEAKSGKAKDEEAKELKRFLRGLAGIDPDDEGNGSGPNDTARSRKRIINAILLKT